MQMRILFVGDVVGKIGCDYVAQVLEREVVTRQPDLVIANAENAFEGRGLTKRLAEQLYDAGVEILTLGNHTWDQKETATLLAADARIVRPANYPPGTPGRGYTICKVQGHQVLIVSLMGRTFLSQLDCPFRVLDDVLAEHPDVRHVIVDIHAETTSEKLAIGWDFDGRVSVVVGTHTHVATADERILPAGTAYLSDVGMVGPRDGILGMNRDAVIHRLRTQLPTRFVVAAGRRQFGGFQVDLNDAGRAVAVERLLFFDD